MKSFSEKLKEARACMNMSQEELGKKIEVSRRSVLSYEKGEKVPRDRVIYRMAAVLGVSVKYLKDENCEDPKEDIELDRHIAEVTGRLGSSTVRDADALIGESLAFLAGGDVPMEEKAALFEAVVAGYMKCKEQAKAKYGKKE
ncbi:MAG: helix-turn-helix domain-containing protein [Oscillospiraceae bacterium]|nr:helix-turn-helix domain-containing protein [Oscillospiraceae bacterium]